MSLYNHSLSLDATTMVLKESPMIDKHVIFVAQYVTIAKAPPAKTTHSNSFRDL